MSSPFAPPTTPPSVFSRVSALAREHGAVNLGQGFPDFPPDEELRERLAHHARHSGHQYAPLAGVPELLRRIAAKTERCHGVRPSLTEEITVTSGATQGIWSAVQATIGPGDEAIVFEPAYDSYAPAIRSVGGVVRPVVLRAPDFRVDWAAFTKTVTARTRLVVVNNPHNPTGTTWADADLRELARQLRGTEIALLSDEVYEHLTFDDREHLSALRYPGLRERAFVVSSFGKTFHVTGWKVGYVVAPPVLTARLRSVHQFTVYTVNTPAQRALADYLAESRHYEALPRFFAAKRDRLASALAGSRLRLLPSAGSYFCLADYSALAGEDEGDERFAARLIAERGVATIPVSAFYTEPPEGQRLIRLCFAKRDDTLAAAGRRLAAS